MILYLLLSLFPVGYGVMYLIHSIRKRRRGQAVSIMALLLLDSALSTVLIWEYLVLP